MWLNFAYIKERVYFFLFPDGNPHQINTAACANSKHQEAASCVYHGLVDIFFLFGNLFSFARYLSQCLPSLSLSLFLSITHSPHSLQETLHSIAWLLVCKGQNTSLHLLPLKDSPVS